MTETIEPTAWRSTPWGAAQGTTHEIKRWSDGTGAYVARVSIADIVVSGPFTALPGYQRWLAVIDDGGGDNLELAVGARAWRPAIGEAIAFDGAAPVHAVVTRPARVWNLIVRPHVPWSARWHGAPAAVTLAPGVAVVHAIATGQTRITSQAEPIALAVERVPAIAVHLGLGC